MNQAPLKTLRKLSTLALLSALALGSGCGDGYRANRGGVILDLIGKAFDGRVGVQELSLNQVSLEVEVEGSSVLFDFSNVEAPGVLSTLDSGGFVLDVTELPSVLGVGIDPELTSADPSELGIQFNGSQIIIDFDDLNYDDTTFIKVDVRFAEGE